MAGATDEEHNKNAALTGIFMSDIALLLEKVEEIEDTPKGFYIAGEIEIRHHDGWLAGYLKSYEDYWVFIPDAKDLT